MNRTERREAEQVGVIAIAPKPTLGLVDAIALIVGLVIGAGIFETPALVAARIGTVSGVMQVWLLGGAL